MPKPRRLNTQLILLVSCILLATGAISGWFTARQQSKTLLASMREDSVLMVRSFAESAAHFLVLQDFAGLESFLLKFSALSDIVQLQVCETDGDVVGHIERLPGLDPQIVPGLRRLTPPSRPLAEIQLEKGILQIWEPVKAGKLLGWIRATYSMDRIRSVQAEVLKDSLSLALLWVGCSIALLLITLRPTVRAINRLTTFARSLDDKKGAQVDPGYQTLEIQELGAALNYASTRLFSTEQQLIHERERLQITLQSIHDGVIATDAGGTVVFMNRASEELTEWISSEASGRPVDEIFSLAASAAGATDQSYPTRVISSGSALKLDSGAILVTKNKKQRIIAGSLAPIREEGGELSGMVIVFQDISERRRVELINEARLHLIKFAENHSLEELLEELLNSLEQITGSLIGFCHLFDQDREQITLQAWSTRTKAEHCNAQGHQQHHPLKDAGVWADAARQAKPVIHNDYQSLAQRKELPPGHAPVIRELVVPVIRGGAALAILGVGNKPTDYTEKDIETVAYFADFAWDVNERLKGEEDIRRLNADLERRVLERTAQLQASNQELEAFCYSVSHDLRAPLRHLDGFVDLLVSNCEDGLNERCLHYLEVIAGSARQMGDLVDDLLKFSRTGRTDLHQEKIDMNQVLQEVLAPVQAACAERTIEWDIGQLPQARGDFALLRQVWANLLENAVKYTRTREVARIEVGSREENGDIIFSVADNGVGFDMQYAGKLFGVFQRLHSQEEFEGTGIGLATVQRIISRHGGRVWAEAEEERGARFSFSLPRSRKEGRE